MNNLIRIKLIVDHITKEPFYPTTHAIGVGYTNKNGECITVLEAIDNLNSTFEALSEFDLSLGYNEDQAFPGNEGAELQDLLNSLTVDDELSLTSENPVRNSVVTLNINLLFDALEDKADKNNVYTKNEVYTKEESDDKYATKTEVSDGLSTKQDTLVSGVNIKTINNDSILGSGNLALSNSDDITKEIPGDDYIHYKALKLGEEQMVVLKSMGDLDIVPISDDYKKFDLNDDGTINYTEIEMLEGFVSNPDSNYTGVQVVSGCWNSGISILNYDTPLEAWYTVVRDNHNDLILYKSTNRGNSWEEQTDKDPDIVPTQDLNPPLTVDGTVDGEIVDAEEDNQLNSNDFSNLYTIIINFLARHDISYNKKEFTGEKVLFTAFDSTENKIVVGYDFEKYVAAPKNSSDPNIAPKSDFIITTFDPSTNVIYCNSFNNKLYRWQKQPTASKGRMVEVNVQITLNSMVNNIQNNIASIQNHITALETYVENLGGVIYHDEPGDPLDPGRL